MEDAKVIISKRAARFLHDGDVINLGIGMPEMVANYLPEGINVVFQSENGIMGMGPAATDENEDTNISNAGKQVRHRHPRCHVLRLRHLLRPDPGRTRGRDHFGRLAGG